VRAPIKRPSFRLILGRQVSLVDSEAPTAQGSVLLSHGRIRMRITSKGQVTIPQAIREQAGLHPSCGVQFRLVGDRVVLEKVEDEGPQRAQEAMVDSYVLLDVITGPAA